MAYLSPHDLCLKRVLASTGTFPTSIVGSLGDDLAASPRVPQNHHTHSYVDHHCNCSTAAAYARSLYCIRGHLGDADTCTH